MNYNDRMIDRTLECFYMKFVPVLALAIEIICNFTAFCPVCMKGF